MVFASSLTITQGQTAPLSVFLIDGNTGNPFNLAGLTGATGIFPNEDGSGIAASGILASADLGQLNFLLDEEFTSDLLVGEQQSIVVQVDQGPSRSIAILTGILTVVAPPYSPVNFGP